MTPTTCPYDTMNQRFLDGAVVVATICSLAFSGGYLWRHSEAAQRKRDTSALHAISNWRDLSSEGHRTGSPTPAVTLTVFTDYQCPGCRQFEATLEEIERRHPKDLAVIRRHFPLMRIHPFARVGAIAAECAADQERFAEFHRTVYANQDSIGLLGWDRFASRSGVRDTVKFGRCLSDSTHVSIVDRDIAAGERLALPGTPSFLVNDSLYMGSRSVDELEQVIQSAIRHSNSLSKR
jgi:protein-disulfide isomerase